MSMNCVRHICRTSARRIVCSQRLCHLRHDFPRHHSGLTKRSSQSRRDGGGDYGDNDATPPRVLLGFGIPIACATAASVYAYRSCLDDVPYTNRRRILATSPEFEASLGHEQYGALLEAHRGGILHEGHGASVTVRRVGGRIASAAERCKREWMAKANASERGGESSSAPPAHPYTYTVIRSPEANAFVLPGNHVFVLTGLFRYVRDEDELASVLGHEMAHNLARHAGEQVSDSVFLAVLRRLALAVDPSGVLLALVIPAEALLWTLPHSRLHEMEADRIGMMLAGEACYDPRAAGRVFSRMWEDGENGGNGDDRRGGPPPEWISTHPGYSTRLSQFDRWMPDALERFELDGGNRCRLIREEMKRARGLAAEIHDRREGRKRNDRPWW
jgi:predicted Zn-dependent protease